MSHWSSCRIGGPFCSGRLLRGKAAQFWARTSARSERGLAPRCSGRMEEWSVMRCVRVFQTSKHANGKMVNPGGCTANFSMMDR